MLKYLSRFLLVLSVALLLAGCSGEETSQEQLLRNTIDQIQAAAENRQLGELMEHVSDNYKDARGRTRKEVRAISQLQFIRNPKIYTFKLVKSLALQDDLHATATVLVALAGTPIDNASALSGLRAELMRFDLKFEFDEQWQIVAAKWQRALAADFI